MTPPIFITGIGTGVGKTIVSAIVTEALQAHYWKPVQAGFEDGTDALQVGQLISNSNTIIHPEVYRLALPASPHIAARAEQQSISIDRIVAQYQAIKTDHPLIIEGAGGILVPLNEQDVVADMIQALDARVILASRNYLGSINHSLLTAAYCKQSNLNVLGWIFNDQYMNYEQEIVDWSGFHSLGSIPLAASMDKAFIKAQADIIRPTLLQFLSMA